jgi:hypothetical protein
MVSKKLVMPFSIKGHYNWGLKYLKISKIASIKTSQTQRISIRK